MQVSLLQNEACDFRPIAGHEIEKVAVRCQRALRIQRQSAQTRV